MRLVFLLILIVALGACKTSSRESREAYGLPPEGGSDIPAATPGPGWEKVERRPDATPTPARSNNPMEKPLDPAGLPVTPTPHG